MPQRHQTFSCSPCEQPVKALIKAGVTLQTGSLQLCYSNVVLRSDKNICSWHRNCSLRFTLCLSVQYRSGPSRAGLCHRPDTLSSSWPLLFLTVHGFTASSSVCSALTMMPGFAFAVFTLSRSLSPSFCQYAPG